jgi:hypothetical protein
LVITDFIQKTVKTIQLEKKLDVMFSHTTAVVVYIIPFYITQGNVNMGTENSNHVLTLP